ncbi:MAG: alkaline phosphatase D family protein [Flavobacteriales bacterium]
MRRILPLLFTTPVVATAQTAVNGPMVGHCDMLEVTIWMQCAGPCEAAVEYWAIDRPDSVLRTTTVRSKAEQAHAFDIVVSKVLPGTTYGYRPVIDGTGVDVGQPLTFRTQPLWAHRTDPPPFRVVLGSCAYINEPAYDRPGRPYGGDLGIFASMAARKAELMLWLGDNVYLREPDWGSRSGFLHRYTHTRSEPALQTLLRTGAHFAIWDDHDHGPNDSDGSFVHSATAREVFDLFWPNPTCGVPGVPGVGTDFSYADVDFFLLDNRTHRVPGDVRTSSPAILGEAQLDRLIRALKYSRASFKVVAVGGQVLNNAAVFENYATVPGEREELLKRLAEEDIRNVVFLTGDRHFTELSSLVLGNGARAYDLTCSPLTSSAYVPNENNDNRVDGTLVTERNFAELSFTGPKAERMMTITVFNTAGEQLWKRSIQREK